MYCYTRIANRIVSPPRSRYAALISTYSEQAYIVHTGFDCIIDCNWPYLVDAWCEMKMITDNSYNVCRVVHGYHIIGENLCHHVFSYHFKSSFCKRFLITVIVETRKLIHVIVYFSLPSLKEWEFFCRRMSNSSVVTIYFQNASLESTFCTQGHRLGFFNIYEVLM